MISKVFKARLDLTGHEAAGMELSAVDMRLCAAVQKAVRIAGIEEAFMAGATFHDIEQAPAGWRAAASVVFSECDGPQLGARELASYVKRIHALGFVPLGFVFADLLIARAEANGWATVLSEACGAPLDVLNDLMRGWDTNADDAAAVAAIKTELEFCSNDEWKVAN